MRILQRSLQKFYYRLYNGEPTPITTTDEWGNVVETGEYVTGYAAPVECKANISPASGASITEQFGNLENYDKVIVLSDMTCPITETTVLYIDTPPVYDETTGDYGPYDYVVRRVAKSINHIAIAVRKVDVS